MTFTVCTALDAAGMRAVLTGGSAAAFYVPNVYQSLDADFVLAYGAAARDVTAALAAIGFVRRPSRDFAHPDIPYTVEFPVGPLAIGNDIVTAWHTERRDGEIAHVLAPTDVVRDRFLHYWAWGDVSAYVAAVRIAAALADAVDWDRFKAWAAREAAAERSYEPARLTRFLKELRVR